MSTHFRAEIILALHFPFLLEIDIKFNIFILSMCLYILLVSRQMSPRERSNLSGLPRTIIPALAAPAPHTTTPIHSSGAEATLYTEYFHPVNHAPLHSGQCVSWWAEVSDSWRSVGSKKLMSVLTITSASLMGSSSGSQLSTLTLLTS